MKDREISRLLLLNIALVFACVLSGIFFFWLHGSFGAAPSYVGGEVASGERGVGAKRPSEPEATSTETVSSAPSISISPAPSVFQHFTYENGMTLPVSGKCSADYFVVLIFPASVDYRSNPREFVFNDAYPCLSGNIFSKTIDLDSLGLSASSTYYVIKADEKDSGTWYNSR